MISESAAEAASLVAAMRTQIETRKRLGELQTLRRPTDDERDEMWLLLRSVRTLAREARRLRLEKAKVRLSGD
jgi:ABC-type phosphate transport system auxiliary subunit